VSAGAYHDGRVFVCEAMCATCIFRPGNLMRLPAGRVRGMVDQSLANDSAIICHSTLDGQRAVCRGFFDRHETRPLQLAKQLDMIRLVAP
jgi:hypothetical protein